MKLYILCMILPSVVFAQTPQGEAYYRQALKRFDSVKTIPPDSIFVPSVIDLDGSAAAHEYLHMETVAAFRWDVGHHPDKDAIQRWVEKDFGMSFDSLQNLGRQFGDDYLVWLYARHLLSPDIQERYLLHRLDWYAKEDWLPHARRFLSDLEYYFPQSTHTKDARAEVQALESKVEAGKKNTHILFRGPVHSLDELIAPYKGKVVYLDIWGTWCGPCREEMKYAPALKQHIDTAQVVFVYLDMDRDEDDVKWREYVQLQSVTGEHLRMNKYALEGIWEALLHTTHVPREYPSFFIFGKDGKLVQASAKRPSDEEALYRQLKEAVGSK